MPHLLLMSFISSPFASGMEDAHATVLSLDERTGDQKISFFAVYDGHGGEFFLKL